MKRKKKSEPDDPEQYARFVKVAEEHLDEDAEEKLEEALKKILPAKQPKSEQDTDR
ncbi:MAG: hypothetical protein ACLP5H_29980 [Desulfomonilaceae bacterium]